MPDTNAPSAEEQARRLEAVNHAVAGMLRRPDVALRLRSAGPDEWSALQIVGHMSEIVAYWTRQAQILAVATGAPPQFGRNLDDPERLEAVRHGAGGEADQLLRQLDGNIRMAATVFRNMTPAQRARTGIHNRLGEITVAQAIQELVVEHCEDHQAQIKTTLGL